MWISILKKQGRFLSSVILFLTVPNALFAHSIPLNEVAVSACDNKQRSAQCQYEGGHNDLYIGSCQYMSESLICVRNQPIQTIDVKNKTLEKVSDGVKNSDLQAIE